jgi:outer membrane autotransporter protein
VSGTFNPNVIFGSFTGTLGYDAHDVFLTFSAPSGPPPGPTFFTSLLPPGSPINVRNVAGAIDGFIAGGGALPPGFESIFTFTPPQIVNAMTLLSGEVGTGAQQSAFQLTSEFLALLINPSPGGGAGLAMPFAPERAELPDEIASAYAAVLKAPPPARLRPVSRFSIWGAAFGGSNSTNGDPTGVGSHDATTRTGAFAAGLDYLISPDTVAGFALAGGGTNWGLSAGLGSGRSDVFQAGVYGSHRFGPAYVAGAISFGSYWMSTDRTVTVAGTDQLSASFLAQDLGARLEGGYRIPTALAFAVTPYAALQAQSFTAPAYHEAATSGSPQFALSYNARTATAVRTELGSRFEKTVLQGDGTMLGLFARVAWAHDSQSNPALSATFLGLPTASFVVNGAAPPSDLLLLTAGAEWRLRNGWSFLGKFDGELANGSQTYAGTGRVRYAW